eukprot:CAMPEP_0170794146 /NCGR_PEP_ID=MMETSP0733-20121128/23190_1 /TAXON_ID=186038 /ORGANISM="Fragilariopsis kerguelensis, Strain L26-C5" /LENGTH=227 /DNA_ID=CAMNT_0011143459 /DNA_START=168 /DNA_END=853 /DNA_ORIENTATION=+
MGNIIIPLPYSGGQSSELWNKPTPALVEPGNGEQVVSSPNRKTKYPNTDADALGEIVPTGITVKNVQQPPNGVMTFHVCGLEGEEDCPDQPPPPPPPSPPKTTQPCYQGTHNSNHQTAYERTDENTVIPNTNSPTKATTIPNTTEPIKAPTKVPIPKTNKGSYEGTDNSQKKRFLLIHLRRQENTHKSTDKNTKPTDAKMVMRILGPTPDGSRDDPQVPTPANDNHK